MSQCVRTLSQEGTSEEAVLLGLVLRDFHWTTPFSLRAIVLVHTHDTGGGEKHNKYIETEQSISDKFEKKYKNLKNK